MKPRQVEYFDVLMPGSLFKHEKAGEEGGWSLDASAEVAPLKERSGAA